MFTYHNIFITKCKLENLLCQHIFYKLTTSYLHYYYTSKIKNYKKIVN
nr:MAG TPA: hypothetical protein [Caudoviricetes sp.]